MKIYELIAPCHFGLEAVLKREITDLGYEISKVEDGKVTFLGDAEAICYANIFLRTAERILLKVGTVHAETFDELFEGVRALPWEKYIPENGKFWVTKASSVNSKLFSGSDIQSIVKKAIVSRLSKKYNISWFEETGNEYPIKIMILKDKVSVCIDTTGVALHKRGYRIASGDAPISETLAASIIKLTPWRPDRILVDPFVGSGTIIIEAAMIAANIAPGMHRSFTSNTWSNLVPKSIWNDVIEEANDVIDTNVETHLQGYDIDGKVLKIARDNAARAGVADLVHFQNRDVADLSHAKKYGFIITNPPYGERLEEKEALPQIYTALGNAFNKLDDWSAYVITPYEEIEKDFNKKATKKRKLYNGMIKTYLYSFEGKKPPKRNREAN